MAHPDRGFRIVPNVFTPSELVRVASALASDAATRTRAGARHVLAIPAVGELAADERLLDIARGFVGSTPFPSARPSSTSQPAPTGSSSGTRTPPCRSAAGSSRADGGRGR